MVWKIVFCCTVILGVLCSPSLTLASSCPTTTLNNLIGTSCSIGDVNFGFLNSGDFAPFFVEISPSDITLTPNGSNPLAPSFTLTGPFSIFALGFTSNNEVSQHFTFYWDPSVINSIYQINSASVTIFDATLPDFPDAGFVSAGNFLGFCNAILQTGGPNANPCHVSIGPSLLAMPDGLRGTVFAAAVDDDVATTSAGSMELQYQLVPAPEPSSLSLIFVGTLAAIVMSLLKRSVA